MTRREGRLRFIDQRTPKGLNGRRWGAHRVVIGSIAVLGILASSLVATPVAQAATVTPAKSMCNGEAWAETLTIAPGDSVEVVVAVPPASQQCISYTQPLRVTDLTNNFDITVPNGGTAWPLGWASGSSLLPGTYVFTAKANAVNTDYRVVTANTAVQQTLIINVETPVPGPTGKPTAVAGVNQATVSWAPPAVNPDAVAYTEVYTYVGGYYDDLVCTAQGQATSCTTDWLPGGTMVQFVTYAYNSVGNDSDESEPSDPVTPTGSAGRTVTPAEHFCNNGVDWQETLWVTTDDTVKLVVDSFPAAPASGYCTNDSYGGNAGNGWADVEAYFDITTDPPGLQWPRTMYDPMVPGTYYLTPKAGASAGNFTVSSTNNTGGNSPNQYLTIRVSLPPLPIPGKTGKPVAVPGDGQATVSWTPTLMNPAAVTYTEVYTYVGGSDDELVCTAQGQATSCTVNDLTNGEPVQFVTYAYNVDDDYGPMSDPSDPVTPGEAPGAPTNLTGTAGDESVTLTWTAPAGDVTGYKIYTGRSAEGPWTLATTSDSSPKAVTGLTNGTAYWFKVTALNGQVEGEGAVMANAITPTSSPSPSPSPSSSASPLAPIPPGSNPHLPADGLPLGKAVLLVNGELTSVTVQPNAKKDPTGLDVESPGFEMFLSGRTTNGTPLGLTPEGALIVEQDRTAYSEGTGFKPNSEVEIYLFSETRTLGKLKTDAQGNYSGSVTLPLDVPAGRHTLQANGFAPNGAVRSLSLGVQLNAKGDNEQRLPAGVGLPSKKKLQASLKKSGSFVVLTRKAITNADQRVRVAVTCSAGKSLAPTGDVRACWVKRTKSGKVTLYVGDAGSVKVTLRMFAPATEDFNRLNVGKGYALRLR